MDADRGRLHPAALDVAPAHRYPDSIGSLSDEIAGAMLFALLAFACWPILVWFGRGSFDGSNDFWGLLALATAALVLWRARPSLPPSRPLALPAGFMLLYTAAPLATALLKFNGLSVALEGAVFLWDGRQIAIDTPCSGIHMLWTGS